MFKFERTQTYIKERKELGYFYALLKL